IAVAGGSVNNGIYTIANVTDSIITVSGALTAQSALNVSIQRQVNQGLFDGTAVFTDGAAGAGDRITRSDGGNFVNDGFFEGQILKVKLGAAEKIVKIQSITGSTPAKLDILILRTI